MFRNKKTINDQELLSLNNKVSAKQNFTYSKKAKVKRYIYGVKEAHSPVYNPSYEPQMILVIKHAKLVVEMSEDFNSPVHLGGWLDESTDKYHLDYVCSTDDLQEAFVFGRLHNQIAIYDTETEEDIIL